MKKRGLKSNFLSIILVVSTLSGISGGLFLSYHLSPKIFIRNVGVPRPSDEKKIEETRRTLSEIDQKLIKLTRIVEDQKKKVGPIRIDRPPSGYTDMFTERGVVLITEEQATKEKRRLSAAVGGPTPKKKPMP